MNFSRPRSGRYETLADQDFDELQSVLSSDQLDRQGELAGPSSSTRLQRRTSPQSFTNSADDSYDENGEEGEDDSSPSDNEKEYQPGSTLVESFFPDQPKVMNDTTLHPSYA